MGMGQPDIHDALNLRRTYGFFDDFAYYVDAQFWTKTLNGSASVAVNSGDCGILTMSAIDSTLNRELYVASTTALFLIQNNKPMVFECCLPSLTQANTNNLGFMFGISDQVGNGMIADTTLDAKSSFSGAVIYTKQGSTVWNTCSSVSTTQNKNVSTTTAASTSSIRLMIMINPVSSSIAEVTYYVNDVQLATTGGRPGQSLIKDQLTYTSAVRAKVFFGLKNGSTTPETATIDYAAGEMLARIFT